MLAQIACMDPNTASLVSRSAEDGQGERSLARGDIDRGIDSNHISGGIEARCNNHGIGGAAVVLRQDRAGVNVPIEGQKVHPRAWSADGRYSLRAEQDPIGPYPGPTTRGGRA